MAMDREKLLAYFQAHYLSRQEVLFKLPLNISIDSFWPELLSRRKARATVLPLNNAAGMPYWYVLTDKMVAASERLCSEAMEQDAAFDPYRADMTSAMTEEMFFTSFVEGAQIPLQEAMDFLQRGTEPESIQEQMIWNNRRAWGEMIATLYRPLDEGFVRSLAFMLTEEMDGCAEDYRQSDQHPIAAMNNEPYEVPPAFALPDRMNEYYAFLQDPGVHPLIKAAVAQAYLLVARPFPEGNERLSRMMSSAVLLRCGYDFFRDISISAVIARESYRYYKCMREIIRGENGGDLTYFVEYYLDLLVRALDARKERLQRREQENLEREREKLKQERELAREPLQRAEEQRAEGPELARSQLQRADGPELARSQLQRADGPELARTQTQRAELQRTELQWTDEPLTHTFQPCQEDYIDYWANPDEEDGLPVPKPPASVDDEPADAEDVDTADPDSPFVNNGLEDSLKNGLENGLEYSLKNGYITLPGLSGSLGPSAGPDITAGGKEIEMQAEERSSHTDSSHTDSSLQAKLLRLEKSISPRVQSIVKIIRSLQREGIHTFTRNDWMSFSGLDAVKARDACDYMLSSKLVINISPTKNSGLYAFVGSQEAQNYLGSVSGSTPVADNEHIPVTDTEPVPADLIRRLRKMSSPGASEKERRISGILLRIYEKGIYSFEPEDIKRELHLTRNVCASTLRSALNLGLLSREPVQSNKSHYCYSFNRKPVQRIRSDELTPGQRAILTTLYTAFKKHHFTKQEGAKVCHLQDYSFTFQTFGFVERGILTIEKRVGRANFYVFTTNPQKNPECFADVTAQEHYHSSGLPATGPIPLAAASA